MEVAGPVRAFSWSAPGSPVSASPERSGTAVSPPRWSSGNPPGRPSGAGIYLPGNAARALRALGLQSAVAERGTLITHQRLCDHRGRLLAEIDLTALWGDVGPCLALHRADLHEVLASHGEPVPARMGRPVQRLTQQADTVTVEFGDLTADRYDLVIGADGIHSTVRRLAVDAGAVRPLGQVAWRFVTKCPAEVTTWTVLLGREVSFLAVPIGRGEVYCYCDASTEHNARIQGNDVRGRLVELLTGFADPVPTILDELDPDSDVHVAPIEEVTLDAWSRGSVLLVGDAAHATSPNMAEGAAMALEDGLVLADCLTSGRRHRPDTGELPGTAPPTHAMGPRPDTPPGPHPQPAARRTQPRAARVGTEDLPAPTTAHFSTSPNGPVCAPPR